MVSVFFIKLLGVNFFGNRVSEVEKPGRNTIINLLESERIASLQGNWAGKSFRLYAFMKHDTVVDVG